jgi:hypothetical protein
MKNHSNSESRSKAIFTLFSQLAGVVQKTGDVISQLSKNYTDMPELTQAGERVTQLEHYKYSSLSFYLFCLVVMLKGTIEYFFCDLCKAFELVFQVKKLRFCFPPQIRISQTVFSLLIQLWN